MTEPEGREIVKSGSTDQTIKEIDFFINKIFELQQEIVAKDAKIANLITDLKINKYLLEDLSRYVANQNRSKYSHSSYDEDKHFDAQDK